jgi:hypothetical protein
VYGATVEAVATFLCRLASKFLSESEPEYATAIDSFIGTSLVVAGMYNSYHRDIVLNIRICV